MTAVIRKWWFWVALIALLVLVIVLPSILVGTAGRVEVSLNQFIEDVRAGDVAEVVVDDTEITYKLRGDDTTYETQMEEGDTVRQILQDAGVDPRDIPAIENREFSTWGNILGIIVQFLPIVFILGTLFYFFRRARSQTSSLLMGGVSEIDPVCGRKVSSGESAGSSTFQNITYRFCSPEHKQEFDSDPVKYLLEK